MKNRFAAWLNRKYPRNYLIENPFTGAVIIALFCFLFTVLYKPLHAHASPDLGFGYTMALYSFGSGISLLVFIRILGFCKWFTDIKGWTVLREIAAVILILTGIGTVIYLMGFLIEPPSGRLNMQTYLDSVSRAFLLGLIPFTFFSAMNYKHLTADPALTSLKYDTNTSNGNLPVDKVIRISSRLKKEELSFCPDDLLYAESDGNYVVFHVLRNNILKKELIRNSISNIEQQLADIPFIMRTHRAFIVNLKKVTVRQGNILGYQLKLSGIDYIIPVSRNNIRKFDEAFMKVR